MNKKYIAVLIIFGLAIFSAGCGLYEEAIKAPQLENLGKTVHNTLNSLKFYYEQKDINNFFKSVSKAYNRKYGKFYDSLRSDFASFNNIKISIMIERMALNKNFINVDTRWKESYENKQTGQFEKRQGATSFIFTNSSRPMLVDMKGDVLFGVNK